MHSGNLLFARQADDPDPPDSPLCLPACTSLSCGGTDFCEVQDPQDEVLKRSLDLDWAFSFNNATNADGTLSKRLFTYKAGSTDSNDYTGDTRPTNDQANTYLPMVVAGNDKVNFGARLATVRSKFPNHRDKGRNTRDFSEYQYLFAIPSITKYFAGNIRTNPRRAGIGILMLH